MPDLFHLPFFFYSTGQKILLTLSSTTIILLGFYYLCFEIKLSTIESSTRHIEALRAASHIDENTNNTNMKITTPNDFIKKITLLSQKSNLLVNNIQSLSIRSNKRWKLHPLNFEIVGKFKNTYQLLQQLSKLNYPVNWSKVDIHTLSENNLKTEIHLVIYEENH